MTARVYEDPRAAGWWVNIGDIGQGLDVSIDFNDHEVAVTGIAQRLGC